MQSNEAEEGPKERGNSNFLAAFAVEPRTRYVSMRLIAFVVTYCEKHLLVACQCDSSVEIQGELARRLSLSGYAGWHSLRYTSCTKTAAHLKEVRRQMPL